METSSVLIDGFSRIDRLVQTCLRDLSTEELTKRLDPEANTIAWLIWHLTRVQDDHIASATGSPQIWTAQGFFESFGLPFDSEATGYGQNSEQVGQVKVKSASILLDYYQAVSKATQAFVAPLLSKDLDQIVDRSYDPPVTLGVRLISVISDNLQHVGQAAFIKGVIERER